MSEQFILNTVFKHETKPIDEQAMRDYLAVWAVKTVFAKKSTGKNILFVLCATFR